MTFFGFFSAIFDLTALGLFITVLMEYFETGLVERFPTLIVSGILAMIGILLWVCGLILQVITKKHRQLYELMLNQIKKDM